MKKLFIVIAFFALASCSSSLLPPVTPPVIPPAPVTVPRPGTIAASYTSWPVTGPGITLACTQDQPPICTGPNSTFATFDRPGSQGDSIIDPQPNPYLSSSGTSLFFNIPSPGAPIFSRQTFPASGTISVEMVIEATFPTGSGYAGPVIYNGETDYCAAYLIPVSPTVDQVSYFSPDLSTGFPAFSITAGTTVALRMDYNNGTCTEYANGVFVYSRAATSTTMTNDPHVAFFAAGQGNFGRWDVYTTP